MLARVDIVSVNCPHTAQTSNLLSADRLALMQPTAYLVNTSRGDVVDEAALTELLQNDISLGRADVYAEEPKISEKLRTCQMWYCFPGSATIGASAMGDKVIINVQTFWMAIPRQIG